jgi:hypothetical protein
MPAIHVSVDNFRRAETHRMFAVLGAQAGAVNRWGLILDGTWTFPEITTPA